jgi:hypothetical protein
MLDFTRELLTQAKKKSCICCIEIRRLVVDYPSIRYLWKNQQIKEEPYSEYTTHHALTSSDPQSCSHSIVEFRPHSEISRSCGSVQHDRRFCVAQSPVVIDGWDGYRLADHGLHRRKCVHTPFTK